MNTERLIEISLNNAIRFKRACKSPDIFRINLYSITNLFKEIVTDDIVFLDQNEIRDFIKIFENEINSRYPNHVERRKIKEILDDYNISYSDLINDPRKNKLAEILSDDSNSLPGNSEREIKEIFSDYWLQVYFDDLLFFINTFKNKDEGLVKKKEYSELNATEKLIIISLLQECHLFPKSDQVTIDKNLNEFIAALVSVSSAHEVGKIFNEKISIVNRKQLSPGQIPEKLKNLNNIRPYIANLQIKVLTEAFVDFEQKVKSI